MALPLSLAAPRTRRRTLAAAGTAAALAAVLLAQRLGSPAVHRALWLVLLTAPIAAGCAWARDRHLAMAGAAHVFAFVVFVSLRAEADTWGPPAYAAYAVASAQLLGVGVPIGVRLQHWLYTPGEPAWWDRLAVIVYGLHFIALWAVGAALAVRRHRLAAPYLLACAALYLLAVPVHIVLPTEPPWLAALNGHGPPIARVLLEIGRGWSPEAYSAAMAASDNNVAAMPSVHMGVAWMIALAGRGVGGWAARAGVLYAALVAFAIVYTGEHWIIDAVAGALLAGACWRAALWFHTREVQP